MSIQQMDQIQATLTEVFRIVAHKHGAACMNPVEAEELLERVAQLEREKEALAHMNKTQAQLLSEFYAKDTKCLIKWRNYHYVLPDDARSLQLDLDAAQPVAAVTELNAKLQEKQSVINALLRELGAKNV